MNRPISVTILAGLQFFYSGFGFLMSVALLVIPQWRQLVIDLTVQGMKLKLQDTQRAIDPQRAEAMMQSMLPTLMTALGVIGIFLAVLSGVLGYYLWKTKKWAWIVTLILQIFVALGSVRAIVRVNPFGAISSYHVLLFTVQFIISILILYYLLRPDVRKAFSPSKKIS